MAEPEDPVDYAKLQAMFSQNNQILASPAEFGDYFTSTIRRPLPSDEDSLKTFLRGRLTKAERKDMWVLVPFMKHQSTNSLSLARMECNSRWERATKLVNASRLAKPTRKYFGKRVNWSLHALTVRGQQQASEVLEALSRLNGHVSYCPIINNIVPLLLTHLSQSETFAVANWMIEDNPFFFSCSTKNSHQAHAHAFVMMIGHFFPSIATDSNWPLSVVSDEMFDNIFLRLLPLQCVLSILDCYMDEGIKILYRFGFGLARQCLISASPVPSRTTASPPVKKAASLSPSLSSDSGLTGATPPQLSLPPAIISLHGSVDMDAEPDSPLHGCMLIRSGLRIVNEESWTLLQKMSFANLPSSNRLMLLGVPLRRKMIDEYVQASTRQLDERTVVVDGVDVRDSSLAGSDDGGRRMHRQASDVVGPSSFSFTVTSGGELLLPFEYRSLLHDWVPDTYKPSQLHLVYSSKDQERSLDMLMESISGQAPLIFVMQTKASKSIIGGFLDTGARANVMSCGGQDCFIFRLSPDPVKFDWCGKTYKDGHVSYSQYATFSSTGFSFGQSMSSTSAIHIEADLIRGFSGPSCTYDSTNLLSGDEELGFEVAQLSVYLLRQDKFMT